LAAFDFVAIGKHSVLNAGAVEKSAIAAFFVEDAAALWPAFDGEMRAGHEGVVRHGKLRFGRGPADEHGLPRRQNNRPAREWPGLNFEHYAQASLQVETRRLILPTGKRRWRDSCAQTELAQNAASGNRAG
jgi:hypothetical protein